MHVDRGRFRRVGRGGVGRAFRRTNSPNPVRALVPLALSLALSLLAAAGGVFDVFAADGVTVSASVDAKEIPLGETLTYTLEVQGSGMSTVQPSSPSGLTNLQLVGGPQTSTSFSFVNGAVSSSRSYIWYMAPQAVGPARISPVAVKIGDKIYKTEPIEITVTPAGSGGRPQNPSQGRGPRMAPAPQGGRDPGLSEMRLENEITSGRVYIGQPVVLTTRLLTRVAVVDVSAGPDPTLPGFLLEESETNVVPERVFRDGREYQSFILMRRILTPTTAGRTVIPPESRVIRVRATSRDIFESFLSPRVIELTRSTSPVTIEALAPPSAGRPPDYSGAVGSFKMDTVVDRKESSVGDAVGIKVTLSGTGNLKTVESPVFKPAADFRIFDPRIEEKASGVKPRTYTKTWNYVVTPLAPGDIAVPSISFAYFDPEGGAYRRLTSSPARLTVKRAPQGAPSIPSIASARREVQTLQRDIRFLKVLDGPLQRRTVPLQDRWWIWTMIGVPIALQPAAWFVRRRGGPAALLPGGGRGRARRRALTEIARMARDTGDAGDAARASSVAADATLRYLGDRCGIPARGLTYEEIDEELTRRSVPTGLREELRGLLELCDLGRFAPEASRPGAAGELLARARSLIERLDRHIGRAA